ncbi:MAG: GNAT family N-acetyltransferase [Steroidobacteraceae bacterium]|nr:GNAT family N-acetyltransferase [Steroidobacteraceae bacterium]
MRVQRFDAARLPELMRWFPDADACRVWGGPSLRFPCTLESFRADTRVDELSSWALLDEEATLVGFGQYYLRVGRCHLGRLAIAPDRRGRGLGRTLVHELCRLGSADLVVDTYSLFVLPGNERALRLYQRLGFEAARYPEPDPTFDACTYMVAESLRT